MRRFLTCFTFVAACAAWAESASYHGVASTKQIMAGVQKPAMDSLNAMMKAGGPKDEKEWAQAQQNAALLAETGQLILMGARPKDQDVWIKTGTTLSESASAAAKAAEAKDLDAFKASLGAVAKSCRGCHTVHKKKTE
jgi:cytochrome c556